MRFRWPLIAVAIVAVAAALVLQSILGFLLAAVMIAIVIAWRGTATIVLAVLSATACISGCTSTVTTPPIDATAAPCAVGWKAHLVDSNAAVLPPVLSEALDPAAPARVRYAEEITQNHYAVPDIWVFLLSPIHLLGAPLGKDGVIARGEVSVTNGDRPAAVYTAEANVSRWYGLYYGSSYRELEHEARNAVRRAMGASLCRRTL